MDFDDPVARQPGDQGAGPERAGERSGNPDDLDGSAGIGGRRSAAAARVNLARVAAVISVVVGGAVILSGSALPVGVRNAALISSLLVFVAAAVLGTLAVTELVHTARELQDRDGRHPSDHGPA